MPTPLRVLSVPGHCVPYRDEAEKLHMGVFVGYDREGHISPEVCEVPDLPYYWGQLQSGALTRAPTVSVEPARLRAAKPTSP